MRNGIGDLIFEPKTNGLAQIRIVMFEISGRLNLHINYFIINDVIDFEYVKKN